MEHWGVALQTKNPNGFDNIYILSLFETFELANEFYDMKVASIEKDAARTFRLLRGRVNDNAFVKVVNGKIVD